MASLYYGSMQELLPLAVFLVRLILHGGQSPISPFSFRQELVCVWYYKARSLTINSNVYFSPLQFKSSKAFTPAMSKEGEQAWHLRRQQWTQASNETLETKKKQAHELNDWYNDHLSTQKHLEMFHKTFVVKRVQPNKPVPLRFAVKMLIHGWKQDGTWPKGMEAPPASDEEEQGKLL